MTENPLAAEQCLLRGFFVVEKALEASPLDPWLVSALFVFCCVSLPQ